jgi:hypothetical protein
MGEQGRTMSTQRIGQLIAEVRDARAGDSAR